MEMSEMYREVMSRHQLDFLVVFDYESYYKTTASPGNKSFTLLRNTYWNYIFDPRFQITGLGYVWQDGEIEYANCEIDWAAFIDTVKALRAEGKRVGIVAHNAQFDCSIANWQFMCNFDYYFCTRLMSVLIAPHLSSALKAVAERLWPDDESLRKGGEELVAVDGVKYEYITEEQHEQLGIYCKQDVNLTRLVFFKLYQTILDMGLELELDAINLTLRGCVEPQFCIDRNLLDEAMTEAWDAKQHAVIKGCRWLEGNGFEIDPKVFSSNQKYAALLSNFGELPTKIEKEVTKTALGQTDPSYVKFMIEHPELKDVYLARKLSKSNLAYTRAEKMHKVADLFDDAGFDTTDMPFFLNYYGALQTGRYSGGQELNQQNNIRGSKHRLSMLAPDDHVISVCDLSNIELRVNLWLCGQRDLLEEYAKEPDYDLYSAVASQIFGFPVNKKDNKNERQMGKAASLGLGFSMGWFGFQEYLASGPLGMPPMFESDAFCKQVKNAYETKHYMIVQMWSFIDKVVIPAICNGGAVSFGPNNCVTADKDMIKLPSGRILRYPKARKEYFETHKGLQSRNIFDNTKIKVKGRYPTKNLWRGLVLENIVQAIARDILVWQMVAIENELQKSNYGWVQGSVHDEVLAAVKEEHGQAAYDLMATIMKTAPEWCEDIPLFNEGGFGREYSK